MGKQKEDALKDSEDLKDKVIAKINELFQDIKAETESKYKTYTAEVDQDRQKIKDIIAHLECTLNDIEGKPSIQRLRDPVNHRAM